MYVHKIVTDEVRYCSVEVISVSGTIAVMCENLWCKLEQGHRIGVAIEHAVTLVRCILLQCRIGAIV